VHRARHCREIVQPPATLPLLLLMLMLLLLLLLLRSKTIPLVSKQLALYKQRIQVAWRCPPPGNVITSC
jgi:hypothetical protein